MATWCYEQQPKEPDKSKETHSEIIEVTLKADTEVTDNLNKFEPVGKSEEKEVLGLDELQLRALLDEAITYKNPKDREGKSELFKELLQEAEADESQVKESLSSKLPRTYYNIPARKKHSRHGSRSECGVGGSSTRSGSLQNLHALGMEGGRGGKGRRSGRGDTLVSARQREGGSLPANVNADNDDLESIIGPNYTTRATLEVSGAQSKELMPEQSTSSQSNPQGSNPLNGVDSDSSVAWLSGVAEGRSTNKSNSIPFLTSDEDFVLEPRFASSCCVGPINVESGTILYPNTPMQHVSMLSIPPQQIHSGSDESQEPKSDAKKNIARKSRKTRCDLAPEPPNDDYLEVSTDNFLNLPLTRWNKYSSFTFLDFRDSGGMRIPHFPMLGRESSDPQPSSLPKAVDENGNFGIPRVGSENCTDRRKPRRVKTKNDKNVILSDQIEGFRGKDNIEDLVAYIDPGKSSLDGGKSSKTRSNQTSSARSSVRVKAKEEESRSLKRRTKEKFQRCNSLEEISKTKLEDLTEESSSEKVNGSKSSLKKKQVTVDDTQLTKKSTWVTKDPSIKEDKTVSKRSKDHVERVSPDTIQDTEFHVVTKKQRKKKRRGGTSRSGSKPIYYSGKGFPAHDRTLERDGSSGLLYQYSHRHSRGSHSGQQARRKSASSVPPSDKSESSDLDSVHSLPVSSSISRTKSGKNSTSGGSTPQASYADIARNSVSPPVGSLGSISRHHSADPISPPHQHPLLPVHHTHPSSCLKKDAMTDTNCDMNPPLHREEYPPLGYRNDFHSDNSTKHVRQSRDNNKLHDKLTKTVPENNVIPISEIRNLQSSLAEMPSSKSVASLNSKRPAVILLDESSAAAPTTELTFGFEVNQQLLQCEETINLCNNNSGNINKSYVSLDKNERFFRDLEPSSQKVVVYLDSAWNEALAGIDSGRSVVYDDRQ